MSRTAFISYSHHDREAAERLSDELERAGVEVIIDHEAMTAGDSITKFIDKSVRRADATVSLVSRDSLLSSWVAVETLRSFRRQESEGRKRFIAGFLDEAFFERDFRLKATEILDKRILEIDVLLPNYADKKLDPVELNAEKTRLFELRNNLGEILSRLRDDLVLDLREANFGPGVEKLVAAVNAIETTTEPKPDSAGRLPGTFRSPVPLILAVLATLCFWILTLWAFPGDKGAPLLGDLAILLAILAAFAYGVSWAWSRLRAFLSREIRK